MAVGATTGVDAAGEYAYGVDLRSFACGEYGVGGEERYSGSSSSKWTVGCGGEGRDGDVTAEWTSCWLGRPLAFWVKK